MRAYVATKLGGIDDLLETEILSQPLGPGLVRVRLRAASLNHRDLLILSGMFAAAPEGGLIPLSDAAGEVVETGAEVWRVSPGDRVALTFNPDWIAGDWEPTLGGGGRGGTIQGVAREEIVVHQNELVRLADHLSFEEAATLPCAAVTAWSALTASRGLMPGQSVLVQGSGGVAAFVIQLAKLFGARVIATTSSAGKLARLETIGADVVIDSSETPDWAAHVLALTDGEGVDRAIDLGGQSTIQHSIAATRRGGLVAMVGLLSGLPKASSELFMRNQTLQPIHVGSREHFVAMMRAIAMHRMKPTLDQVFAWEDLPDALRHLQSGNHVGKIVVRFP